jgi:diguanylate cyclase (GGDEF)-like protein/PAS domain S-box-containing protein
MQITRRLASYWPSLMAAVLLAFVLAISSSLYYAQSQLRSATDARLLADSQRRAAAIEDFLAERLQDAAHLAASHEIEAYLTNSALGMSPRYGLNASLDFVEQKFQRAIEQMTLRGSAIYTRIEFLDDTNYPLVAVGGPSISQAVGKSDRTSRVYIDEAAWAIVARAPIIHKESYRGAVVTTTDMRVLSKLLISAQGESKDDVGRYQEFLLADRGDRVVSSAQSPLHVDRFGAAFARLPENRLISAADIPGASELGKTLALRTAIKGAPLSILTVTSEAEAYGQLAKPAYVIYLGAVPILLIMLAFGFERMRQRTAKLQSDYFESDRRRTELSESNHMLSEEIMRRESLEARLRRKTEVLDALNADLRIAATAFESQEGMIVADSSWTILRVNRVFAELTGYTADELVGRGPDIFQLNDAGDRLYTDIVNEIHETGRWQGDFRLRSKDGSTLARWLTISAVKSEAGVATHYIGTFYDVSEQKKAEDKIKELAFFDQLTGLPNRTLLLDRARQAMKSNARNGTCAALVFIDLDNFKTLNDTLGHDIGDILLKQTAIRLAGCIDGDDTVSRFGGDEFVVLLTNIKALDEKEAAICAEAAGEKMLRAFDEAFVFGQYSYPCTASIGIALFSEDSQSLDELLKHADLAMYEAKAAGRNGLRFFDPQMQTIFATRAALETDLRDDIRSGNLALYYQPQVDSEGRMIGAEALVRWPHAQRGMLSPAMFIPLAESTGLILPLGEWVLETACRQLAEWAGDPEFEHLTIAVNVSALQLHNKNFVGQVMESLVRTGADPRRLKLELTESFAVNRIDEIIEKMTILQRTGVTFSLDDFGTGYSSLSYLKRLPLDQLKIDQSFVRDILEDPNDAAISKMIIALGATLGLSVIAEGVENEWQRTFLAHQGCRAFQGYFFGRPMPADEFEAFATRFETQAGIARGQGRLGGVAATG